MLVRVGLVLGLAGVLAVAFLHWQGNVSVISAGAWLGLVLGFLGLAGTWATLFIIQKVGRAVALIAVVTIPSSTIRSQHASARVMANTRSSGLRLPQTPMKKRET